MPSTKTYKLFKFKFTPYTKSVFNSNQNFESYEQLPSEGNTTVGLLYILNIFIIRISIILMIFLKI